MLLKLFLDEIHDFVPALEMFVHLLHVETRQQEAKHRKPDT
jgi:hypothetical protein